jgi:glycosyltransferase involved in cell wall biosynthesis
MRLDLGSATRPSANFHELANGVDTELFTDSPDRPPPALRLLYVGRLDPRKRVQDLLHAVALLAPTRPALRLSIVGTGRECGRLRSLAQHLGIIGHVVFLGQVPHTDMPEVYRRHDVLVLPSGYEPFGLAALEAMACGTVAVTSSACAQLGQTTYAVGDVAGLCSALSGLLDDPTRLAAASREACRIAREHDWRTVAERLAGLFREAMDGARRHAGP